MCTLMESANHVERKLFFFAQGFDFHFLLARIVLAYSNNKNNNKLVFVL